jgi:hypothetical protein
MSTEGSQPDQGETNRASPGPPAVTPPPALPIPGRLKRAAGSLLSPRALAIATLASPLVGLVGILIGYYIARDRPKALELHYTAKLSLFDAQARQAGGLRKLQVTYNGRPAKDPVVVSGRLVNSGEVPIAAADVTTPPAIDFTPLPVLDAFVAKTDPPGVEAECRVSGSSVAIVPRLLNPGDTVDFNVVCDGDPGWRKVGYRIGGIRRPATYRPPATEREALPARHPIIYLVLMAVMLGMIVANGRNSLAHLRQYRQARRERDPDDALIALLRLAIAVGVVAVLASSLVSLARDWMGSGPIPV